MYLHVCISSCDVTKGAGCILLFLCFRHLGLYFVFDYRVHVHTQHVKCLRVQQSLYTSRRMRKPAICICENKGADQLRGKRETAQRLCSRYTDSTIPLLLKSEISSFQPASVTVHAGLRRTWSETKLFVFSRTGSYILLMQFPSYTCCLTNCCVSFAVRLIFEPLHEKTNNVHRRKQSRRSAVQASSLLL